MPRFRSDQSFRGRSCAPCRLRTARYDRPPDGQTPKAAGCKSKTDAVVKEPRRLLRHTEGPVNLIRTDAVLEVNDLPHGREPFV